MRNLTFRYYSYLNWQYNITTAIEKFSLYLLSLYLQFIFFYIYSFYIYKMIKHFVIIQRILFGTNTNKSSTSTCIQCP